MTENAKLEELNKRKEEYLKELERVNDELKKLEEPNNPSDLNSSKDPKKEKRTMNVEDQNSKGGFDKGSILKLLNFQNNKKPLLILCASALALLFYFFFFPSNIQLTDVAYIDGKSIKRKGDVVMFTTKRLENGKWLIQKWSLNCLTGDIYSRNVEVYDNPDGKGEKINDLVLLEPHDTADLNSPIPKKLCSRWF